MHWASAWEATNSRWAENKSARVHKPEDLPLAERFAPFDPTWNFRGVIGKLSDIDYEFCLREQIWRTVRFQGELDIEDRRLAGSSHGVAIDGRSDAANPKRQSGGGKLSGVI